MRTSEAIEYFGTRRKLAELLGISTQATYDWGDEIPELRAYQIQVLTKNALVAAPVPDSKEHGPERDPTPSEAAS